MNIETDRELQHLMRGVFLADQKAYEQALMIIYRELLPFVRSKVNTNKVGSMDTEDIVQEVLISIHKVKHTYDPSRPFAPWLYAIANHKIIDLYRKKNQTKRKLEKLFEYENIHETLNEDSEKKLNTEKIDLVFKDLSNRDMQLLKLSKVDGYSIKEIAEQMHLGISAVKVALHRIYKKIRVKEGI